MLFLIQTLLFSLALLHRRHLEKLNLPLQILLQGFQLGLLHLLRLSSNKVFSFGRDHGYHGRILSHGVVAVDSLHVKGNQLTGYCFTPQDGNALLSSVAASVHYFYEDSWVEKMSIFDKYIFKNI